jgi:hypothetical protein
MKEPLLPLVLQEARDITKKHPELTTLVAQFYLSGPIGCEAMTDRFIAMAPATGEELYSLYLDSGKTFVEFVEDVNSGKYALYPFDSALSFLDVVGRSVASMHLHMIRIALRHIDRLFQ